MADAYADKPGGRCRLCLSVTDGSTGVPIFAGLVFLG
jgi:hypothetical protein